MVQIQQVEHLMIEGSKHYQAIGGTKKVKQVLERDHRMTLAEKSVLTRMKSGVQEVKVRIPTFQTKRGSSMHK